MFCVGFMVELPGGIKAKYEIGRAILTGPSSAPAYSRLPFTDMRFQAAAIELGPADDSGLNEDVRRRTLMADSGADGEVQQQWPTTRAYLSQSVYK